MNTIVLLLEMFLLGSFLTKLCLYIMPPMGPILEDLDVSDQGIPTGFVVYFDQRLGAAHAKRWSK